MESDVNHGLPQSLTYTLDSTSRTVTFTIPSLLTNGLIVLEGGNLESANHDYTVGVTDTLRGGAANYGTNGRGNSGATAVHGCCHRWARFDAIDLGTNGVSTLSASVTSAKGGPIEFRADSPTGAVLATVNALAGDSGDVKSVTASTTITGVHNIYAVWPRGDVTLTWWQP